jgi:hypothetical protein
MVFSSVFQDHNNKRPYPKKNDRDPKCIISEIGCVDNQRSFEFWSFRSFSVHVFLIDPIELVAHGPMASHTNDEVSIDRSCSWLLRPWWN